MEKIIKAIAIIIIAGQFKFKAQVSAYTFAQSLKTYSAATTGTIIGSNFQDDDYNQVNLPFSFTFNGATYTSAYVSSNGYLSFSNSSNGTYNPISDLSSLEVISAFGNDLVMATAIKADLTVGSNTLSNVSFTNNLAVGDSLFDYGFDFAASPAIITAIVGNDIVLNTTAINNQTAYDVVFLNGYIKQSVTGTAPTRVCEFEFKNFTRFSISDESLSFIIKLYETSNKIEVLYGTAYASAFGFMPSEVGLKGSTTTDYNSREVGFAGSWANSQASSSINDVCNFTTGLVPMNGQSYEWSPTCTTPSISVSQSNSLICVGASATLIATGANSYTWSNGSNSSQIVVTPTATSTYTLIGGDVGCTTSLSLVQSVAQNPSLTITQTKTLVCKGNSATLTVSGANTYTWSNGSQVSALVVSPTITAQYTVTGSNGSCVSSKTVSLLVNNCTGVLEHESEKQFLVSVYPNPFSESISLRNNNENDYKVIIRDAIGKEVYNTVVKGNSSEQVNTQDLNSGFYFVSVLTESGMFTKKIVKR